MDTDPGLLFIGFITLVSLVGMGSIIVSMIWDSDTIVPIRFNDDTVVSRNKNNFEIDYLEQLSRLEEETHSVIIED